MKILMVASEMTPFAGTGQMADNVADLSANLQAQGHEVEVILPLYRSLEAGKAWKTRKSGIRFQVQVGSSRYPCEIREAVAPSGVKVYFVERDEFFDRSGLYGHEGRDYQDNSARFIFFTKCAIEFARRMEEPVDVVHFHGWQTALGPVLAKDQRLSFSSVLTPHSLEYQGNFWSYDFALTNLPGEYFSARGVEYYGSMNCLKAGILFADAVILPTERAVSEYQTPQHGCGLENILSEYAHKLNGIPDGTEFEGWNPATDEALASKFSLKTLKTRAEAKAPFLQTVGLEASDTAKVFAVFGEASPDLGLLFESLDRILAWDVRLALFGPVPEANRAALETAVRRYAGKFVYRQTPEEALCRQALAAADAILVPGASEPSVRWISRGLRYGAIPLARQCNGLHQFVKESILGAAGTGWLFHRSEVNALVDGVRKALDQLEDKNRVASLQEAGMSQDFSKTASARTHASLYARLRGISDLQKAA